MIVPCIVNSWLYTFSVTKWLLGTISWVRIPSASAPAKRKPTTEVTR